jgi:predicted DNA-binding protein
MSEEKSVRTTVYLSESQSKKLSELKKKRGVTKSFIIRTALDKYLNEEA